MCIYRNNDNKWKHWFLCFIERYLTKSFARGIISLTLFQIKTLEILFLIENTNCQRLACICKLCLSILPLSTIFLLNFVPTVCNFLTFHCIQTSNIWVRNEAMYDNIITTYYQDYLINKCNIQWLNIKIW